MKPRTGPFRTGPFRTGPLARVHLFRFTIFAIIVGTAVLAFTLQAGIFRNMFRGALIIGAVLLFGSYLVEAWFKRRSRPSKQDRP